MAKNLASVSWATARAISVLPQPGGPYSSTPLGASMPSRSNSSGYFRAIDDLSHAFQLPPQAADVLVGHAGAAAAGAGLAFGCRHFQQRVRRDHSPAPRHGALHQEIGAAVAEQRCPHAIAGRRPAGRPAGCRCISGRDPRGTAAGSSVTSSAGGAAMRRPRPTSSSRGTGIFAHDAVDLDASLPRCSLKVGSTLADVVFACPRPPRDRRSRRPVAACRRDRCGPCPRPTSLPVDSLTFKVSCCVTVEEFDMVLTSPRREKATHGNPASGVDAAALLGRALRPYRSNRT